MKVSVYIGEDKVDLFDDEKISITQKLNDIEKLSNVFTDFTNSFTVPATQTNNRILKHYYDVDINNGFNASVRVSGFIEIDTLPFKFGQFQLEGVTVKQNRADNYKITFYSKTTQLTNLFGDDLISQLDYTKGGVKTWNSLSQFNFTYTETNVVKTLQDPAFLGGNLMTPLIAYTNRDWEYGGGTIFDISSNTYPVRNDELNSSLRILRIIEGIETKYNISFSRGFFGTPMFNQLFMWCNSLPKETTTDTELDFTQNITVNTSGFGETVLIGAGLSASVNLTDDIFSPKRLNTATSKLIEIGIYTIPSPIGDDITHDGVSNTVIDTFQPDFFTNKQYRIILKVFPEAGSNSASYRLKVFKNGVLSYTSPFLTGAQDLNATGNAAGFQGAGNLQFFIESSFINFSFKVRITYEWYFRVGSSSSYSLVGSETSPLTAVQTIGTITNPDLYMRVLIKNVRDIKTNVVQVNLKCNIKVVDLDTNTNFYVGTSTTNASGDVLFTIPMSNQVIYTKNFKIYFQRFNSIYFTSFDAEYGFFRTFASKGGGIATLWTAYGSYNNPMTTNQYRVEDYIPNMKVIEFLQGIMKMFKLVIRPITTTSFYLDTLDNFYSSGTLLDITKYVDQESVQIDRPVVYNRIQFTYQPTDNVAGKNFRLFNDPVNKKIGYGDYQYDIPLVADRNTLSIELPFENMLFERLPLISTTQSIFTNVLIGQSIILNNDQTLSPNNGKPILFFNNGLVNFSNILDGDVVDVYPIKFKFQGNAVMTLSYSYLVGTSNNKDINLVTDTLNFDSKIDPWFLEELPQSLFSNYWLNWINTIYSIKQRKFRFEGYLPPRYIQELSLNDKLIIGQNRYKINDYTIDLVTGKTTFNLFNDI